ncbi:MAG TPA: bifunctional 5,10-methylenetetrahydrofolate dehydrogenase/5,10-methenyltetrahydrofolate cyclohydrolase [Exilispira sp.]|nr:bifunctional 5,10-methylenetetrahydrofolate dehydrogenase/5,10-methenyltetrahydrofolate cyclohydrolase [Exilispira sp.]
MIQLNGKEVKNYIEEKLSSKLDKINKDKKIVILENSFDPSAQTYAKTKKKLFEKYGINYSCIPILETYGEDDIIKIIKKLNDDDKVAGIFLELPLPNKIDSKKIIDYIDYKKDVEGVTTKILGRLFSGDETIAPPTAMSIIKILEYYKINISSSDVVVINRSMVIGKPLIALLLNRNATVTVCHTKTKDIDSHILRADIVISGVARPHFFEGKKLKENCVVIDASINFEGDKIIGDFDPFLFEGRDDIKYTPTPGGVGVVTNSVLLENCVKLLST